MAEVEQALLERHEAGGGEESAARTREHLPMHRQRTAVQEELAQSTLHVQQTTENVS